MPAVHITASTNKKRLYFQCQIHASVSSSTHAVTHLLCVSRTSYTVNYLCIFNFQCMRLAGKLMWHAKLFLCIFTGEWIAGATCMYIANYLAQNYGKNQQVVYD